MLSLLLYHYDCLLFYHSFCQDSTKFLLFTDSPGCYTENRTSGVKVCSNKSMPHPLTHIQTIQRSEREVFPLKKIASFTIDHIKLQPGIYVSRKDHIGTETITTFDLRMTSPNEEPVMNTAEVHTIEHLGATFLRNHPTFADKTIYFGPMGCRTGFYLLLAGDHKSREIVPLITEMFTFIRDFHGEVPGASPKDCGNYLDMNLSMANYLAKKYLDEVLTDIPADRLIYPE